MNNTITYLSSGMLGDFIFSLSVINEQYLETGKKGILYISEKGDKFRFGLENTYNDTFDIIKNQEYIAEYKIYNGENIDIDLTLWRTNPNVDYKNWYIKYKETYNVEWGKHKWLDTKINSDWSNKVLINTTSYRWPININFQQLYEMYKTEIVFISFDVSQYDIFKQKTGLDIEFYKPNNFEDLSTVIHSCKLFVGSQSAPASIAFALHKNIILGECIEDYSEKYGHHYIKDLDKVFSNVKFVVPDINLNTPAKVIKEGEFSLIYKTYKNDLEWFEYSLLSLQKFLDFTNIYEIIIYTHDVVRTEVKQILDKIKMNQYITFRIIPVHYNYHGYIKQQQIKADSYKDCETKYVVILDSDLLLRKPLNFNSLIRLDGKIEWKYLKIEDNNNREEAVFTVWKKAYEESTLTSQTCHYMRNGFPFIFTRKSLEEAANKFMQMHNCDYEGFCHNRCGHNNIRVEDSVREIFSTLSQIFTEFEYLGFYCHNFSNDYIFIHTLNFHRTPQEIEDSHFIQYWSHGGITPEIKDSIIQLISN